MNEQVSDVKRFPSKREEKKPPKTNQERLEVSFSSIGDVWKALGALEYYRSGKMMGNMGGPDDVSIRTILDRFSTFINDVIKDAYVNAEKSVPKETLDAFTYVCKAVAALETMDVYVPKMKLISMVSGLANEMVMSADPDAIWHMARNNGE